jgi:TonB-linked SusC/RagA family outer membrane protein
MKKNKFLKVAMIMLSLLLTSYWSLAQTINVTGTVNDPEGMPLPGVSISVVGTSQGTISTLEGTYSIDAPSDGKLEFKFMGYLTTVVDVNNLTTIDVALQQGETELEQVVVIGYGTSKKSDLTGAVISANLKDFEKSPNTNLIQTLQGTVPGLNIGQVNSAGATPDITIRGVTTINGSKNVLIVLDGVIYNNSLSSINPADIESVDILKDASSTAVYGAQAANGVICITTKKGKAGKSKISFSSSYSIQTPTKNLRTMNRQEFIDWETNVMWNQSYTAASGYTEPDPAFNVATYLPDSYMVVDGNVTSTDFNWWDVATRNGSVFENKLSFSGGNESISYLFSLGNTAQKNQLVNDDFKRNSIRINLDAQVTKWWKVGIQTFGSFVNQDGSEPTLWTLYSMNPLTTPYKADGTLNPTPMETARDNPLMGSEVDDKERHNYFYGNLYSEIQFPIKGLSYRINFGNNYTINEHFNASKYGYSLSGAAYQERSTNYDYTFDNIVNYARDIDKHSIAATLVYGVTERKYSYSKADANTFGRLTMGYNSLEQGTNQFALSDAWEEALLYQMARLNYKYNNRYLITATVRRDGYSGFAENYKSAIFPSVALGWVLSEESFLKVSWIDFLKLRAGYGISGNQTNKYASQSVVASNIAYVFGDGGTGVITQNLNKLANNDLKWEKTSGLNLGLDFNLLNNRIQGSIEVYKNKTTNLLWDVAIPSMTGFTTISSNVGELQNKGIELNITSRNIVTKDFQWSTTFNISANKNEVVSLTGQDSDLDGKEDNLIASNLFVGESVSAIYGYKIEGIYQVNDNIPTGFYAGNYKVIDTDGIDGISIKDKVILGKKDPAYRFGILNTLTYKNFTLSFFINSIQGGKNGYLGENYETIVQDDNARRANRINENAKLFWSPINPDGIYSCSQTVSSVNSDQMVYKDRSFIRLQDVTLSYNLPKTMLSRIAIENVNIFINCKNLLTLTNWKGWDPEANYGTYTLNSRTGNINKSGSDYSGRPVMRSITGGINITF